MSSSDPLAHADIWTGAPNDREYDAVYAAVTATERGRWFLAEYANRNRHADTKLLADALARIEAAIARGSPEQAINGAPASVANLDALRRGAGTVAVHAVEKPVSPDTTNGSAHDEDAAAVGLYELAENKQFAEAVAAMTSQLTSPGTKAETPAAPLEAAEAPAEPPDRPIESAIPSPDYTPKADVLPLPRSYIEPPDFVFRVDDRKPDFDNVDLPAPAPSAGPGDDPADLFDPPGGVAMVQVANGAARVAAPRPTLNDSLIGLRGLSEDELIALFG